MKNWLVYLVECSDGTLYCGATNNLQKRLVAHNKGKGAKYTRGRLPVSLKASRDGLTKSQALKLEHRVKKARRDRKEAVLIAPSCEYCGHRR
jgi:putative endonuclease